jgi:molybdopterin synthase sulfur carrier subunit
MTVKIKVPKNLQKKTNGDALVVVHGATVRECFEALIRQYRALQGEILDDKGMIQPRWMIHLNDKSITTPDASTLPVKEGDMIDLLPVIAGG